MAPGGVLTAIPCVLTSMQQLLQSVDKQDLTSPHCNPSSNTMCPHCNTRCPHLTAIHLAIPGLLTTIPIAIAGGVLTAISHHNPSCSVIPITKSLQYLKQSVDKQAIYWHPPKKHRMALLPKVSPKNLACRRKTLGMEASPNKMTLPASCTGYIGFNALVDRLCWEQCSAHAGLSWWKDTWHPKKLHPRTSKVEKARVPKQIIWNTLLGKFVKLICSMNFDGNCFV